MSDQPPMPLGRRHGLLSLTPYLTVLGVLAVISLLVMHARQSEDGPLDLLTTLIALAVGITVFCGAWWAVTSRGARELARWWAADDPTAHVHVPIWGGAACALLAYLPFFTWLEARIGVFGLIFFTVVLQLAVLSIVAPHLARRLDRDLPAADAASTLKWSLLTVLGPMALLAVTAFVIEVPVLTESAGGDLAIAIFVLAPLIIVLLYVGFAIIYGAADAVEHTWDALFRRSARS